MKYRNKITVETCFFLIKWEIICCDFQALSFEECNYTPSDTYFQWSWGVQFTALLISVKLYILTLEVTQIMHTYISKLEVLFVAQKTFWKDEAWISGWIKKLNQLFKCYFIKRGSALSYYPIIYRYLLLLCFSVTLFSILATSFVVFNTIWSTLNESNMQSEEGSCIVCVCVIILETNQKF